MSPIEIRLRPNHVWRALLLVVAAVGLLYFQLGYLPRIVWVLLIVTAPFILIRLVRGQDTVNPVITLDEQGIFDKRLKVGVIEWEDIRRIASHSIYSAEYISLHLHDTGKYESRRPVWLKLLSQVQRVFGMSSFAIFTNGLDVDRQTLAGMIHERCEMASAQNVEIV
ncbi:MAG TPA: STM3941 family protein [Pyrinomonadaceae bacterium]|nr:STM3941 family protein [Pyrinomonadaceae bacterium]